MTGRIKVLHLITRLELGGAQLNTLTTFRNLDRRIFMPYLAAGPGGILDQEVADNPGVHWIRNLVRPVHPQRDTAAFMEIIRLFRRLQPAVVHTHSSKAGILGRFAARWCRVPVVVHTVHGFPFSPFQSPAKQKFYQQLERLGSGITTTTVFVSREDREIARRIGLTLHQDVLIRSGFCLEPFQTPPEEFNAIHRQYHLAPDDIVIGTIAPFKPQKGLLDLVEIARKVLEQRPRVIFLIAGDGALRPALEKRLKKLGIEANFRLPGFRRDIAPLIHRFDIGLTTALWEGLPQSLVQLRLARKPVVATDIPGNREIIHDGQNGYLPAVGDYRAFTRRLVALIDSAGLRKKLGNFSRENFGHWDARHMVRAQEELYQRLIAEKEKP